MIGKSLEDEVDVAALVHDMIRRKWVIFGGAVLGFLLALIPCFLIRPEWTSTSIFVSATKSGGGSSPLSSLASLAGLGRMGAMEGKESYYDEILRSRDFLKQFVSTKWDVDTGDPKNLRELFALEFRELLPKNRLADTSFLIEEACIKALRKSIKYQKDAKTGVMNLSVTLPDPVAAYQMQKALLSALQEYNTRDVFTKAQKDRHFVEEQLKGFELDLERSENRLTNFRKQNVSLNNPSLMMEHSRLVRSVEIASTLVIEFRKQAELSKFNEEKEKDFIDVIQNPSIPIERSKPIRKKIAAMGMIGGVALSLILVFILALLKQRPIVFPKQ